MPFETKKTRYEYTTEFPLAVPSVCSSTNTHKFDRSNQRLHGAGIEWVRVRIYVLQVTQAGGALVVEGENRLAGRVGRRANSGIHGALQFVQLERRLLRHARTHRLLLICGLTAAGRCGGGALPLVIRDRRLRPHSAARRRRTAAAQHRYRTRLLRERRLERVHHSKL